MIFLEGLAGEDFSEVSLTRSPPPHLPRLLFSDKPLK